jgi:hypothetical protein
MKTGGTRNLLLHRRLEYPKSRNCSADLDLTEYENEKWGEFRQCILGALNTLISV